MVALEVAEERQRTHAVHSGFTLFAEKEVCVSLISFCLQFFFLKVSTSTARWHQFFLG